SFMAHAMMWTLFFLLLLDLTNFSKGQDFWKHHVDYPKTNVPGSKHQYCNVMMQKRGLIVGRFCKQLNTFIHEKESTITNICNRSKICGSSNKTDCHESPFLFNVTHCYTSSYARPPTCRYRAKLEYLRIKIWLACEGIPPAPVYLDP
uniref:Ribonuclease A-domain domain-containing protein n=1 Tax=Vombatus ursinus TaxID=29139 RepID=A0A4X2LPV3_VOMUR